MSSKNGHSKLSSGELMVVTPAVAADWLAVNTSNRRMSAARVKRMAMSMQRDEWIVNGETIKLDRAGNLLDGQHRLAAVVMANVPIQTYVVSDLDPAIFDTIDVGQSRSFADMLHIADHDIHFEKERATFASFYWYWKTYGDIRNPRRDQRLTHQELREYLQGIDPPADVIFSVCGSLQRKMALPTSVGSILYYEFLHIDEKGAHEFFRQLLSGEGLKAGMPIYTLRELLVRPYQRKRKHDEIAAVVIKAWNGWRDGEDIRTLYWRGGGDHAEGLPIPH